MVILLLLPGVDGYLLAQDFTSVEYVRVADGLVHLEVMQAIEQLLVISFAGPLVDRVHFIFVSWWFRTIFRFDIVLALLKHAI